MDKVDFDGIDAMNGDLPLFKREWRIQDLSELVKALEKDMEQGKFRTRQEVVDGILKPLFAQLGQVDAVPWPADPPDPTPSRRVALGDRVWFHDFASGEIVTKVVVGGEADFERDEVTRDSSVGHALLGAREGEERETRVPGEAPRAIRIVLIRGRDPD